MTEVYLALGANVGDSQAQLTQAVRLLGQKMENVKQAPIYRSKAVGYTNQADFLNTAVSAQTDLSPTELLKFVKKVEKQIGRVKRFRWGPREIDIDIIFYGDQLVDLPGLTVPHPRFSERDFVLQPLVNLNPKLVDPRSGLSVQQLLKNLPADERSLQA